MSAFLTFTVEGPPVPWARTSTYQGRRITPKRQRTYQDYVGYTAQAAAGSAWPLAATYAVELDVFVGTLRRSDLDNFAKQLGDSCNEILWLDDSQIAEWHVRRHLDRERPRLEVRVHVIGAAAKVLEPYIRETIEAAEEYEKAMCDAIADRIPWDAT